MPYYKVMTVKIAGYLLRINFHETDNYVYRDELVSSFRKAFSGFIVNFGGRADFTIQIVDAEHLVYQIGPRSKSRYITLFEDKKTARELTAFYYLGISQLVHIINNILDRLLKDDGLILHGSSSLIGNRAYVFLGESGAGKTTITRLLAPRFPVLADDRLIIKKENGVFYHYQSSHFGKAFWVKKNHRRLKIAGFFFLAKSEVNRITELHDQKRFGKKLVGQILTEPETMRAKIRQVKLLAKSFPAYILEFTKPGTGIANKLEALPGTAGFSGTTAGS